MRGDPVTSQPSEQVKGFLRSLFDLSFKTYVTPKVVRILFVLYIILAALITLGGVGTALFTFPPLGIIFLILSPLWFLLWVTIWRVGLELTVSWFNLVEAVAGIAAGGNGSRPPMPPAAPAPPSGYWVPPGRGPAPAGGGDPAPVGDHPPAGYPPPVVAGPVASTPPPPPPAPPESAATTEPDAGGVTTVSGFADGATTVRCGQCGADESALSGFCGTCGARLSGTGPA
jgi:Domain of unknown function (DUF4282)